MMPHGVEYLSQQFTVAKKENREENPISLRAKSPYQSRGSGTRKETPRQHRDCHEIPKQVEAAPKASSSTWVGWPIQPILSGGLHTGCQGCKKAVSGAICYGCPLGRTPLGLASFFVEKTLKNQNEDAG